MIKLNETKIIDNIKKNIHMYLPLNTLTTSESMINYEVWKKLRRPFVLPTDVPMPHTCKWERFAFDKLGCVLCAAIHDCAAGKCTQTHEAEDGTICLLSGVVINRYNFQMHEWDNNYPSFAMRRNQCTRSKVDLNTDCIVHDTVNDLLVQKNTGNKTHHLVNLLSRQICTTIAFFATEMQMKIKILDYRNWTIGILYLMKNGISMHGVHVLPKISALQTLLPPESQLHRQYNFKCKNITDVENKMKLYLRDINVAQLQKFCWNTNLKKLDIVSFLN
jgi:hypothetical protein